MRQGKVWERFYTEQIIEHQMAHELADWVNADIFQRNHFEAYFRKERVAPENGAIMEFGKLVGRSVGYKLRIPDMSRELFDIRGRKQYLFYAGIWVPPAVAYVVARAQLAKAS